MTLLNRDQWEIAGTAAAIVAVASVSVWFVFRKRPTAEELERARRDLLVQSGRLVDGMLLDVNDVPAEDGRLLTMLVYNYRIGGVDYECSQDISALNEIVADVRVGFPCTVRYQPGNPQNSIVLAETWSGLRRGLPSLPSFADPDPLDKGRAQHGRD